MMNGNMGGTEISGKWMNTRTGEVVHARSIVNDGEEAVVVTDIGMIPMTQFTEFVQMGDDEISAASAGVSPASSISIPDTMISGEDKELLMNAAKDKPMALDKPLSTNKPASQTKPTDAPKPKEEHSANYAMIDKLFTKFGGVKMKVEIDWESFPKEQISTLTDIFDIPKKEIAEYIALKYASLGNISLEIEKAI